MLDFNPGNMPLLRNLSFFSSTANSVNNVSLLDQRISFAALGCLLLLSAAFLTIAFLCARRFNLLSALDNALFAKPKSIQPTIDDPFRLAVSKENLNLIKVGFYTYDGKNFLLTSGKTLNENSQIFPHADREQLEPVEPKYEEQKIFVVQEDAFETAAKYVQTGEKVAVLSYAGQETPGGGAIEVGSYGFEEDFCYRSDLIGFMKKQFKIQKRFDQNNPSFYPVYDHLIHTPDITLFRRGADQAYELMEPVKVGAITCGVPQSMIRPKLKGVGTGDISYANEEDAHAMKTRIQNVLKTAYDMNYDTVILGAYGCGAYGNPPQAVAKICKDVIDEFFQGAFKNIVFAIIDDLHSGHDHNPEGNFSPFFNQFERVS
jgi:uncharacterized protein (TIGR02452 family)